MVCRLDEVKELHGGRVGYVDAIVTSETTGPTGTRKTFELVVMMDDGTELRCGESDLLGTGRRREPGGARR